MTIKSVGSRTTRDWRAIDGRLSAHLIAHSIALPVPSERKYQSQGCATRSRAFVELSAFLHRPKLAVHSEAPTHTRPPGTAHAHGPGLAEQAHSRVNRGNAASCRLEPTNGQQAPSVTLGQQVRHVDKGRKRDET
jgi:hypothetical protein